VTQTISGSDFPIFPIIVCDVGFMTDQNITTLLSTLSSLQASLLSTQDDIDQFYTQINGVQVFMMQCGFAFLEAGCVETKNVTNILMKNFIDCIIVGIVWYLWAYGLAFGDVDGGNQFWGTRYSALSGITPEYSPEAIGIVRTRWFFQYTFAAASTTIVSGSIAARARFPAYMLFSVFYGGWIYPVACHWMWSGTGWMSASNPLRTLPIGVIDFAGSGVVHLMGGTAALVGAWVIGPRHGRFDPTWDGDKPGTLRTFRSLWSGLGTFLLWYGWYGFNPGSSLKATDASDINALSCINTTLAACAGALSAMFLQYFAKGNWDLVRLCNGVLGGLVAITAGCAVHPPWGAIIVGLIAGVVYYYSSILIFWLGIDDPVEATAVHLLNGVWGLVAVGLFADKDSIGRAYAPTEHWGAFLGGGGLLLGVELLSMVMLVVWTGTWSFILFSLINYFGYLRVSPEVEKLGLDLEHVEMTEQQKRLLELGPFKYDKKASRSKGFSSDPKSEVMEGRDNKELAEVVQQ